MADETTAERRSLVLAAVGFFGLLLVLIGVAVVFAGDAGDQRTTASTLACAAGDDACLAAQRAGDRPGIIPEPGEGHAPDEPGERGGWEQLALFGAVVAALATIVGLAVRSSRRARRRAADGTGPGPRP